MVIRVAKTPGARTCLQKAASSHAWNSILKLLYGQSFLDRFSITMTIGFKVLVKTLVYEQRHEKITNIRYLSPDWRLGRKNIKTVGVTLAFWNFHGSIGSQVNKNENLYYHLVVACPVMSVNKNVATHACSEKWKITLFQGDFVSNIPLFQ